MTEQANPCLPSCYRVVVEGPPPPKNRVVHAPGCQNAPKASEAPKEGYWPGQARMGRLQPAPAPKAEAPKEWDSTTVCFGKDDCPNCEREKRTKPAHTQKIHGESAGTTGSHPRSVRGSEYAPDTVLNAGDSRHEDRKPAPAPVSDKGAEVEPVTEAEADKEDLRILLAWLAEAGRETSQNRNTAPPPWFVLHSFREDSLMPTTYAKMEQENSSLRADIAAKDAEVASLKAEIPARMLRFPQRRLGYRILSLEHELAAEKAAREKAEARVRELIRECGDFNLRTPHRSDCDTGRCKCGKDDFTSAIETARAILANRKKEESK